MPSDADAIVELYERHADAWSADRQSGAWAERIWHERFANTLPPRASVLDIGCGCGWPVAEFLAGHGHAITGVDSSSRMVAISAARLPAHNWVHADMRALDLDHRFDAILAWDSFFHLTPDDQRSVFAVFARHAAPHCALLFNTGPRYGIAVGAYRGDPLYHASLDAGEYQALLDRIGFDVQAHAVEARDAGGRTVWLCRRRP